MTTSRNTSPWRSILLILIALALAATACSVPNETVSVTISADHAAGSAAREAARAEPPAPIETNDQGEQLLPRVISGSYASSDCDFLDVTALPQQPQCGWLTRPLHGGYDVTEIELPVLIFEATSPNPATEPLVYLHGGPSDGVLRYFEFEIAYELLVAPFVADRDVIVFDQRGTGLAEPDLRCDHPFQWYSAYDEDPATYVPRTASVCAFDVQQDGIRLDQFSRQSSADDVMVLARELGHEQIDLHGSSWGGILGYTVMQLHPNVVRSAVLDSPLSIETDLTGSMPSSFYEAMQAMQANCDLSSVCTARHGNIIARYIRVFDELEISPLQLMLDGMYPVTLTADELSYLLFGLFYSPEAIAIIPDMLLDLENGNVALAEQLAWDYGFGWGIDFTFLTYMCTDIVSASSQEQVDAQQIGIEAFDRVDDAPDGRGHTAQTMCDRMKVRQPAAPAMREVTPTTPMIVFSGSMDPITPFSSGRQIVDSIPNGTFIGFDDLSHGVTHEPCALDIMRSFLADPEAAIDSTCSLAANRPVFEFAQVALTVPAS